MLGAAAKQAGMGRAPERGAPAVPHEPVADVIVDRDQVPRRGRTRRDRRDLGGELRPDPLVGIDLDDPLAATGGDAGVAARAFALPGALEDAVGEAPRDVERTVLAAVEHDDDLV